MEYEDYLPIIENCTHESEEIRTNASGELWEFVSSNDENLINFCFLTAQAIADQAAPVQIRLNAVT